MNADTATQLRLLDLQAADTALAQLAHRRSHLPELAALAETDKEVARRNDQVADARARVDDIAVDQRRLENDVDTVRTRTTRDQARLQAGGLPARELEGLQHEIATLARRQSTLEDELLEIMELGEQADTDLAEATSGRDAITTDQRDLTERRDAALAEIDTALAQRRPEREAIAAEIPADVMNLYERARTQGGTGAAMLKQRRCEGCHIELSGSELAAVRKAAPDEIVRCDNCRAILIRTAESGL